LRSMSTSPRCRRPTTRAMADNVTVGGLSPTLSNAISQRRRKSAARRWDAEPIIPAARPSGFLRTSPRKSTPRVCRSARAAG
jgi:hypothetical protein